MAKYKKAEKETKIPDQHSDKHREYLEGICGINQHVVYSKDTGYRIKNKLTGQ